MEENFKIYWDNIDQICIEKFEEILENFSIKKAMLFPNSSMWNISLSWFTVSAKEKIFPYLIWYDIWCWTIAFKTKFNRNDILWKEKEIFEEIQKEIPCWKWRNRDSLSKIFSTFLPSKSTNMLSKFMNKAKFQLWTLWWWNHFIEVSYDEKDYVWIVVHTWSRELWFKIARYYMIIAKWFELSDCKKFETIFDRKKLNKNLKISAFEKYLERKENYLIERFKEVGNEDYEDIYALDSNSKFWKNYMLDMKYCLEFAKLNRLIIVLWVYIIILQILKKPFKIQDLINDILKSRIDNIHNYIEKDWKFFIHRKWATKIEKGGIVALAWNMKVWTFLLKWKWNKNCLNSCSCWAWRVITKVEANEILNLEDFVRLMKWITAKVDRTTLDESPRVYKNIWEILDSQKDIFTVKSNLKPIINIK